MIVQTIFDFRRNSPWPTPLRSGVLQLKIIGDYTTLFQEKQISLEAAIEHLKPEQVNLDMPLGTARMTELCDICLSDSSSTRVLSSRFFLLAKYVSDISHVMARATSNHVPSGWETWKDFQLSSRLDMPLSLTVLQPSELDSSYHLTSQVCPS